ncbi:hypothetical protein [Fontibacillus sp. BL9]|uniref:hypothetical protein n=1 Tax=Fontibacillus sp. BL9 TaxID=3389971 RepID=UPI003978DBB6
MAIQKTPYYVSVTHRLIQEIPNDSTEFEVLLDDEDLAILQDKIAGLSKEDEYTFKRAPVPYKSTDHDEATEHFNRQLTELYVLLYRTGSERTRKSIIEMGVLSNLTNTDYNHPGYGGGTPLNK